MKLLIFLLSFITVISCSDDFTLGEGNNGPYVGEYEGVFNCIGELEGDNGDDFDVEIRRVNETDYILEIDRDFYLTAYIDRDELVVPLQGIERLFGMRRVDIDGYISELDNRNLNFNFYIDSDDGETSCVTILFED